MLLVIWAITIKTLYIFLTPNELQILGINMSVGIDGCLGKPMIREGQGLDIFVRRSLRDVFRKVPTFSLEVKVSAKPNVIYFYFISLKMCKTTFLSEAYMK